MNDPHIKETNYIVEQPQLRGGSARTVRPPLRLSETPPTIRRGAPALGEHSREVLSGVLGFSDSHIDALVAAGAIGLVKE